MTVVSLFSLTEASKASDRVKMSARLDSEGMAISAIRLCFLGIFGVVAISMSTVARSGELMARFVMHATVKGKRASPTTVADARAILPLPCIVELIICELARRVN